MRIFSVVIILLFSSVKSENILAIVTTPYKSHASSIFNLLEELAKTHKITFAVPKGFEMKNPSGNISLILPDTYDEEAKEFIGNLYQIIENYGFMHTYEYMYFGYRNTENFLKSAEIQDLLKSNITFDLVLAETFLNDAIIGFSEHFHCPHITFSSIEENSITSMITQNPSQSSYFPHLTLDYAQKMTFAQRLINVLYYWGDEFFKIPCYNMQSELYRKHFPNSQNFTSPWKKFLYGSSFVFIFSHFSISYLQSRQPNLIEVGGMHIKEETGPLPDEIQSFIDSSEHGAIYFSLGSMIKAGSFKKYHQEAILQALSKRKEKIILKWSGAELNEYNIQEIDKNKFLIKNWFPSQNSILAHSKVLCFINHGGLLGHQEAIYHGVPTVSIPLFIDHKRTASRSVYFGYGVKLELKNLTFSSMTWALDEILDNEKYSKRAKEMSRQFKDQPQKPVDLAKFYIEYTIRHKGAVFLKSHVKELTFIQLYNIDVYFFIIFFIFTSSMLSLKILKMILRKNVKNEEQNKEKKIV